VDDFFRSVLCSGAVVPPAIKYFFDFLDEQALKHDNVDEETIHIWKTNRYTHTHTLPEMTLRNTRTK
jgi:plexin B